MVILGIVLIILSLLVPGMSVLWTIGLILLIVGVILHFVPVGGSRRNWW
jgi:membrane protein implicated in regulation of membrane protease activity